MSDVGALVLTLGERTTARALASIRSQTIPVAEVVVVEGVRPFHRAFNAGIARTTTPFVLQVDADFVLDPDCGAVLRRAMAPNVGIAVGALRDLLIGPVAGVKLFRRECFRSAQLRDTISPEVDHVARLAREGWQTRYVLPRRRPHTLGAHRPRHTLNYVFGTYYILGAAYVSRGDGLALLWRLGQLRRSRHPMALLARLAMGHGMFAGVTSDTQKPAPAAPEVSWLRKLLDPVQPGSEPFGAQKAARELARLSPRALLDASLELGGLLRAGSHVTLRELLRILAETRERWSWIAEVGLAHGALGKSTPELPEATLSLVTALADSSSSYVWSWAG